MLSITSSIPSLHRHCSLSSIKTLVQSTINIPSPPPQFEHLPTPIQSLSLGHWVKLICGASFEDAADVRNLSLVYTLAGVDCIDCAADESIVSAVNEGIDAALSIAAVRKPWVMISVNDDQEDLHFRKAEFNPEDCPSDCSRPCEKVCPANAILLEKVAGKENITLQSTTLTKLQGGVITERCYGCGRCFPVCPYDKIRARTYVRDPDTTSKLLQRNDVDAIEIHTRGRRIDLFHELWNSLGASLSHVKLVAVSIPYIGESTVTTMNGIYDIMQPPRTCYNLWQLDGRPMSGDIGRGATREAVAFAVRLAASSDKPHGFYQIAGGTNSFTVDALKKAGLFRRPVLHGTSSKALNAAMLSAEQQVFVGGIAYGGYARKIVGRVLSKMPTENGYAHIEEYPECLLEALKEAYSLVGPVKGYTDSIFDGIGEV